MDPVGCERAWDLQASEDRTLPRIYDLPKQYGKDRMSTQFESTEGIQAFNLARKLVLVQGDTGHPASRRGRYRRGLDFVVSKMRRDTEPLPHVHERDDEFFYILSGSIRFYTGARCSKLLQMNPCFSLKASHMRSWFNLMRSTHHNCHHSGWLS